MDLKYFSKNYVPSNLQYRDKEQERVRSILRNFYENHVAQSLLLQGYTGCGKTATVKNLIQKEPWNVIYVSGILQKSPLDALRSLSGLSYRNETQILQEFIEDLTEYPRAIIIDEIAKMKNYNELVMDLNAIHREIEIPVVIVTNNRMFLSSLPDDVRTTLCFERVTFSPYIAQEQEGIIKQRLKLADAKMPKSAINYIAAIAAREKSARVGIDLAKNCLLSNNFSIEYITEVKKSTEMEEWYKTVSILNPTERKILNKLIDISNNYPDRPIRTKDLIKFGDRVVPLSTVSNIITIFEEDYGFVSTKYVNEGKKTGRYRKIQLNSEIKEELSKEGVF